VTGKLQANQEDREIAATKAKVEIKGMNHLA